MCNILIVSHSETLAKATYEFVNEMKQKDFKLDYVGGTEHGKKFGSDPAEIVEKYKQLLTSGTGILVVYDLGSSLLNAKTALDLLEKEEDKKKIEFAQVAFIEGALAAVCSNNDEMTPQQLKTIVEGQCQIKK